MSERDRAVLHAIFNPSTPLESLQPVGPTESEATANCQPPIHNATEKNDPKIARLWQLQRDAIRACDDDHDLDKALLLLNEVIERAEHNIALSTAARNNRAQVRRLLNDNNGALSDLNYVVEATAGQGSIACQAFTQRALLLRLAGDDANALKDFHAAAELGCPFAKKVASENNPYAAMCNKMLMQMFANLKAGKREDADFTKETFDD